MCRIMFKTPGQGHRQMSTLSHVLDLPPPFRLVALREVGDAFAHACAHAGELGAGTLVFVGRFDVAEFAVVLEPPQPLAAARLSFYAGMIALADALTAYAPPETPIAISWPDAVEVYGELVGGGRFGWPDSAAEGDVPDWLVFGAEICLSSLPPKKAVPHPRSAALADLGFAEISAQRLVEGFARHLMLAIDRWEEGGLAATTPGYLARLRSDRGAHCAIAPNGDLRVESANGPAERRELRAALAAPSWLAQAAGAPPS